MEHGGVMPNRSRIKVVGWFICIVALIIVGRLYYLEIIKGEYYRSETGKQYVTKTNIIFDRGSVFFSPKSGAPISAATLATGYTVVLEPGKIKHPEDVYNVLSGILPKDLTDENFLLGKIESSTTYIEIAKRLDEVTAKRINDMNIEGVYATKERWRLYPGGKTAANVLGFVGYGEDGVTLSGRYGLEKSYNDVLTRNASDSRVNFFAEIFSNVGGGFLASQRSEGSVVTTIEPTVQAELEKKLAEVMNDWQSNMTGGIVMDPSTGEIYAMAVNPSFDPNNFSKEKDSSAFGNPLVDGVFEMGSIIKPLIMAAGLDVEVIGPRTTYYDAGTVIINGSKISNYDLRAREMTDMQKVLDESLNVGMAFVVKKLGNENVTKYFKNYGFGEETGIDLPGEVRGQIANLESPRELEHVTASFGQGIAVSPIQTVRALSALANGGVLPNPHVVKRVDYISGVSKMSSYESNKRVIKEETSEMITRMLVNVVDKALLGGKVKLERYTMAAKTGTAQIASPEGGYYTDRYLHSFFGYFPAYRPRFIVFLFTVYPKGAQYASHTLTMPFIDLVKFLINYYEVPPDR